MSLRMATLAGFLAETRRMVHWRSMQTLVIDTNGIVKKLEQRGFSHAQAEGITEALKELETPPLFQNWISISRSPSRRSRSSHG